MRETHEMPPEPPRPAPHPLFTDRSRHWGPAATFSAATAQKAHEFRKISEGADRSIANGLWPAARPAREMMQQAAWRTFFRAPTKLVLLGLIACGDENGVALVHRSRFALLCTVTPDELIAALEQLERAALIMMFSTAFGPTIAPRELADELCVLVRRPEYWPLSARDGDAGTASEATQPRPAPLDGGAAAEAGQGPILRRHDASQPHGRVIGYLVEIARPTAAAGADA
jgi:hypothetical protein